MRANPEYRCRSAYGGACPNPFGRNGAAIRRSRLLASCGLQANHVTEGGIMAQIPSLKPPVQRP